MVKHIVKKVKMAPIEAIFERYKRCVDYVDASFIQRTSTIKLISLALLTKQHLLLEGPAGVSKSMLIRFYIQTVFKDWQDWFFEIQMSSKTCPEDLFGPMSIAALRDEKNPRIEYNTYKMAPEARVMMIDETFRAQPQLLNTMFNMMVEREFKNGQNVVKCPLSTCFGTTNFVVKDNELAAFLDRWSMRNDVVGLKTVSEYARLAQLYRRNNMPEASFSRNAELNEDDRLTWDEFEVLQNEVDKISVEEEVLDLYAQMFHSFKQSIAPIAKDITSSVRYDVPSDRMFYNTLRLIAGMQLFENLTLKIPDREMTMESLAAARLGWTINGNTNLESCFDSTCAQVIQQYRENAQQRKSCRVISEQLAHFEEVLGFGLENNLVLLTQNLAELNILWKTLNAVSPKEFTDSKVQSELAGQKLKCDSLRSQYQEILTNNFLQEGEITAKVTDSTYNVGRFID